MIIIDQDEVRNSLKDDVQNSEKVDFGMDDDSQQFNDYGVYCKLISGIIIDFLQILDIIDNFNNIFILEKKKFFFFENCFIIVDNKYYLK